jgi:hypothetical protein
MDLLLRDTVGIFPNAFTNEFCDKLIGLYHQAVDKNESYEGFTGYGVNHTVKKSVDWGLLGSNLPESAECISIVHKTFIDYVGTYCASFPHQDKIDRHYMFNADNYFEFFQVTRYEKGSGHYGSWHCETSNYVMSRRIFVFLLYLNDVKEGGETEFLYAGLKTKPKKGTLVIHPAGFPYFHKGNVPISDDKYILVSVLSYNQSN